jgi:hypothetical protein
MSLGRGLEIPRLKSSNPTCFNCYPQKKYLQKFLKTTRENMGIEKVVPQTECKAKIGYIRYDNQCNGNVPGMH